MKESTKITTTSQGLANELKKSSLVYNVLYIILLCVLGLLLIFNYFAVFTTYFYPTNFKGQCFVGVMDTSNYHNVSKGQMLVINKYRGTIKINIGDEVFYSGNSGEGSGVVEETHIPNGYITVSANGEEKNIDVGTVIGQVVAKKDNSGYVVWFLQDWVGTAVLNGLLVIVLLARTIWGFTTEPSKKGKELKKQLKAQKLANKKFKIMYKNYTKTGLDVESFELLDGDFEDNKQKIIEYAKAKDIPNAYKFLLQKVHRVYVCKHKITVLDRKKITNCIELMFLADEFDIDVEYMLTDLILKTHVIHFDLERFISSANEYLSKPHNVQDLECFESVLYVLFKKNKHLRKVSVIAFCESLEVYLCRHHKNENCLHLLNLCNYIKKLI